MFNKRLLGLVPHAKKYISATVILQWLCLVCNILIMLSVCNVFNAAYTGNFNLTLFQKTAVFMITLGILRFYSNILWSKTAYLSSQNVKKILRESIYNKLTQMGTAYHQTIATSEAVQISTEGVNQLEVYFSQYMPQLFYSLLAPITLFLFLATICLKAAIVLLICVPLIPLSIIAVQKYAKKLLHKYWGAYTNLGDSFLENLQGMTTLKIYQADEMKHKEMNENAETFRKITMKVLAMQLNSISVMDLVAYGGAAMGIILAILEFSKGNINFFSAMAVILLSADFFIPLRLLGSFFHIAMNGMAAADKIFKLLDAPTNVEGTERINDTNITFKNVSFEYEKNCQIINDISLHIPPKSFISFVGQSGCGKSTLAALINGRLKGFTGSIQIGSQNLSNVNEKDIMDHITLINHNSYLFKGTVRYNLKMGNPNASDAQMYTVLQRVNFLKFIKNERGLDTPVMEQGSNLSGGQRQRLALARALLHDTPIYIFDEATSNIDAESESDIMAVIKELAKTKTVLLISHRLANVIDSHCIYVLDEGKIVESGTHKELMKNQSVYQKLYTQQSHLESYGQGGAFNA